MNLWIQTDSLTLYEVLCFHSYSHIDGTNPRSVVILDHCSIQHVPSV